MPEISKKNWTIYILECGDKTLYCGITNDVDRRLRQHKGEIKGGAKYTKSRQPLMLVYSEKAASRSEALKREYVIKKLDRKEKKILMKGV